MDQKDFEWRWCLVGNIIDTRLYGEEHELKEGTKNFSPGTKVYVNRSQWGDGGDQLIVIGKPKDRKQYIECVIRRDFICNWRLQKVYSPTVLNKIKNSKWDWWKNDNASKNLIKYLAKARNEDENQNEKYHYNTIKDLTINIEKISLSEDTYNRIKNQLNLNKRQIIKYCKNKILDNECNIYRDGKKFYCEGENLKIVINAINYEILSIKVNK